MLLYRPNDLDLTRRDGWEVLGGHPYLALASGASGRAILSVGSRDPAVVAAVVAVAVAVAEPAGQSSHISYLEAAAASRLARCCTVVEVAPTVVPWQAEVLVVVPVLASLLALLASALTVAGTRVSHHLNRNVAAPENVVSGCVIDGDGDPTCRGAGDILPREQLPLLQSVLCLSCSVGVCG